MGFRSAWVGVGGASPSCVGGHRPAAVRHRSDRPRPAAAVRTAWSAGGGPGLGADGPRL